MLHAGCGVGGHLAAELKFADAVVCRDGSVSDVTWREDDRCEPTSSLTVTLSDRCRRYHRPHRSATLGKLRQFPPFQPTASLHLAIRLSSVYQFVTLQNFSA